MKKYNCVIIGGGSAGLAAACALVESGIDEILIVEQEQELGGILNQCIHNGFGLHTFNEELTGPSYAERYINMVKSKKIEIKCDTTVISINEDRSLVYCNKNEGYTLVQAKAILLSMGCRERSRGAIGLPGYRPSGIWTAGTAQRYLNMEGYLCGKRIFILGSGDIGLIMARRMTLEGAIVCGVAELMPYSNGLPRNIKQCLEDFDIPLYLSHTITDIKGKTRVQQVVISQVDEKFEPIENTEKTFDVDTILLSVGLIPENALSEKLGIKLHPKTKGPVVSESYMTSFEGIFACGNVLHVHDLVDFVSREGQKAGYAIARYINDELDFNQGIGCENGNGVAYVVPNTIQVKNLMKDTEIYFRVTKPSINSKIKVYYDDICVKEINKKHLNPAEMEKIVLLKEDVEKAKNSIRIEVSN